MPTDFISRRLAQMSPMGAVQHIPLWTGGINRGVYQIATIQFAGERWTRVIKPGGSSMVHIKGDIDNHSALAQALGRFS